MQFLNQNSHRSFKSSNTDSMSVKGEKYKYENAFQSILLDNSTSTLDRVQPANAQNKEVVCVNNNERLSNSSFKAGLLSKAVYI
jgi:hypothetical protein